MPGAASRIPASPAQTPSGHRHWLCSPGLANQAGLGSTAGCTKRVQPGGISFRSLMMEKYLLGAANPSLLPAGAGLGTASIDFDSRSMEISSGEARVGCADPATKRFRQPAARWDPIPGSALRISSVSAAAVRWPGSPAAACPLCGERLHGGGDVMQPVLLC